MDYSKNIEFIKSAISDTQSLINFIETKTAFLITLIGIYCATIISYLHNILAYSTKLSNLFFLVFFILVILILLCFIIIIRIISPKIHPKFNITIDKDIPKGRFFLHKNKYHSFLFPFFNSDKYKLDESLKKLSKEYLDLKEKEIIEILTFELMKISYIRNIKHDRLQVLIRFVIVTSILFICFLYFYNRQIFPKEN